MLCADYKKSRINGGLLLLQKEEVLVVILGVLKGDVLVRGGKVPHSYRRCCGHHGRVAHIMVYSFPSVRKSLLKI